MPTPIAVYFGSDTGSNAIVLGPFTPTAGEYWTILSSSWDTANPTGTPTGGGQTYTAKNTAAPGGFNGYARIDECTVSGSPGSMSVTVPAPTGSTRHSAALIRWPVGCTGGAVNSTVSGSGAPSANVTTTAASSGIAQVSCDVASQDPASRAYRNSATEAGILDGHLGSNSVQYHAYVENIGAVGTYAIGLSAPGSQTWVLAAAEVKAPSGISQAINTAAETDTAIALGRSKTRALGLASETDAGQTLARRKTRVVGLASEADTAQALARTKTRALGLATSTEVALPLGRRKTRPVGTAAETDLALPLGGAAQPVPSAWTVGRPETRWAAGQPETAWTAGTPATAWEVGAPHA